MEHNNITPSHLHEVVDRTSLLNSMFDQFILDHSAVKSCPALLQKATAISDALGEFYQESGNTMWELLEEDDQGEQEGEQKWV